MRKHRWVTGLVLLAGLGVLAAGAAAKDEPKGGKGKVYKTPEDAFNGVFTALEKKDWKGFTQSLTKDSRDQVAVALFFLGQFAKGFAGLDKTGKGNEQIKKIDAVLKKHGLTDEVLKKPPKDKVPKDTFPKDKPDPKDPKQMKQMFKLIAGLIKDRDGFIADMLDVMNETKLIEGKPQLEDVKITGNTAKGVLVTKKGGKEQREPITFKKVGGGWKVELPMPMGPPKGATGPPPKK
jgi:hypothetical protein